MTYCSNNLLSDDNNNCQQHLLQTIFFAKRLEIILIKEEDNKTIINQVVQANIENSYCSKLYYLLKTDYSIKEIDFRHFFNLLVDTKNYIYWFGWL